MIAHFPSKTSLKLNLLLGISQMKDMVWNPKLKKFVSRSSQEVGTGNRLGVAAMNHLRAPDKE
jgi:hypothetical protein